MASCGFDFCTDKGIQSSTGDTFCDQVADETPLPLPYCSLPVHTKDNFCQQIADLQKTSRSLSCGSLSLPAAEPYEPKVVPSKTSLYTTGARVQAEWTTGHWAFGVVEVCCNDGTYAVRYDDGFWQSAVKGDRIRLVDAMMPQLSDKKDYSDQFCVNVADVPHTVAMSSHPKRAAPHLSVVDVYPQSLKQIPVEVYHVTTSKEFFGELPAPQRCAHDEIREEVALKEASANIFLESCIANAERCERAQIEARAAMLIHQAEAREADIRETCCKELIAAERLMRERFAEEIEEVMAAPPTSSGPGSKCNGDTHEDVSSTEALLDEINELKAQKEAFQKAAQEASTEVIARQETGEREITALKNQLHEADLRAASARQVALREADAYELAVNELQTQNSLENQILNEVREANARAMSAQEVAFREAHAYDLVSSELRAQLQTQVLAEDDDSNHMLVSSTPQFGCQTDSFVWYEVDPVNADTESDPVAPCTKESNKDGTIAFELDDSDMEELPIFLDDLMNTSLGSSPLASSAGSIENVTEKRGGHFSCSVLRETVVQVQNGTTSVQTDPCSCMTEEQVNALVQQVREEAVRDMSAAQVSILKVVSQLEQREQDALRRGQQLHAEALVETAAAHRASEEELQAVAEKSTNDKHWLEVIASMEERANENTWLEVVAREEAEREAKSQKDALIATREEIEAERERFEESVRHCYYEESACREMALQEAKLRESIRCIEHDTQWQKEKASSEVASHMEALVEARRELELMRGTIRRELTETMANELAEAERRGREAVLSDAAMQESFMHEAFIHEIHAVEHAASEEAVEQAAVNALRQASTHPRIESMFIAEEGVRPSTFRPSTLRPKNSRWPAATGLRSWMKRRKPSVQNTPDPEDEREARIMQEAICGICLDQLKNAVALTPCGHIYCAACIECWRQQCQAGARFLCPQCRGVVKKDPIKLRIVDELLSLAFFGRDAPVSYPSSSGASSSHMGSTSMRAL